MSTATATTGPTVELDPPQLQNMLKAIEAAGKPTWTLISPAGRVWIDDQQGIARVILQNIDVTTFFKGNHEAPRT